MGKTTHFCATSCPVPMFVLRACGQYQKLRRQECANQAFFGNFQGHGQRAVHPRISMATLVPDQLGKAPTARHRRWAQRWQLSNGATRLRVSQPSHQLKILWLHLSQMGNQHPSPNGKDPSATINRKFGWPTSHIVMPKVVVLKAQDITWCARWFLGAEDCITWWMLSAEEVSNKSCNFHSVKEWPHHVFATECYVRLSFLNAEAVRSSSSCSHAGLIGRSALVDYVLQTSMCAILRSLKPMFGWL